MCIFKGIIRYRLKNTIINALLASLVQKFCKKMPPIIKGEAWDFHFVQVPTARLDHDSP